MIAKDPSFLVYNKLPHREQECGNLRPIINSHVANASNCVSEITT